jgi:Ca2+-binding EF-hand superfamily protein
MTELDDDGDGTLNRDEFVKFADALERVIRRHELRAAFNMFDANRDAKIDLHEVGSSSLALWSS